MLDEITCIKYGLCKELLVHLRSIENTDSFKEIQKKEVCSKDNVRGKVCSKDDFKRFSTHSDDLSEDKEVAIN